MYHKTAEKWTFYSAEKWIKQNGVDNDDVFLDTRVLEPGTLVGFDPSLCCPFMCLMGQVIPLVDGRGILLKLASYGGMVPTKAVSYFPMAFPLCQHDAYHLPLFYAQMAVLSPHFGYLLPLLYPKWCVYLWNLPNTLFVVPPDIQTKHKKI